MVYVIRIKHTNAKERKSQVLDITSRNAFCYEELAVSRAIKRRRVLCGK